MAVQVPEWLTRRGSSLREGRDGSWYLFVDGEPQYRLKSFPAAGKFACEVEQTINSHRFDGKDTYATADQAVQGGLDELRKKLGW